MASIDLIERMTILLAEGKHQLAIDVLTEEAQRLKLAGKMSASKRLQSIIKKIPANKSFGGASSNDTLTKTIDLSRTKESNLVNRYYSSITIDDVVLNASAKEKIKNLLREWEDVEHLSKHNLFPSNRILFYGLPGTGKTMLANAIAHHLDFPLVLVRLDELISSFLGETGKNIRDIFEIAKRESVVLLLDEIDTIAKFRSDEKELGELKRIVTVLLQHIDFFPQNSIIIGATNHEEILDKAIWRRFPLKIELGLPDLVSRKLLFKLFLDNLAKDIDLDLISEITDGLNGSEIYDIVQNAKKYSVMSRTEKVDSISLAKSYLAVTNGERGGKKPSKDVSYRLCQHLKDAGFKFREIEAISGIPYTTLKYNLK